MHFNHLPTLNIMSERIGVRVNIPFNGHVEADEQNRVVIAIADTGPGLSPEELERAFEPFRRVERTGACSNGAQWKIKAKPDGDNMSVNLDTNVMQQLEAEQRALLDTIDELRVLGLGAHVFEFFSHLLQLLRQRVLALAVAQGDDGAVPGRPSCGRGG